MYTEETRTGRNLNFSERNSEKLKNSQICVNKLRKKLSLTKETVTDQHFNH